MELCDLLITDTDLLIRADHLEKSVDIAIKDGKILETGKELSAKYRASETLKGKGKLFMPGLIDSHIHTGQQLLKGLVLDAKPIIWTRIMLPFESTLTPEKMKLSAELAALEMIHGGTAGFIDAGSYCMDAAAKVYVQSGLRGVLSVSSMDAEGLPKSIAGNAREAVEATDRLYDEFHGKGNLKVYYSLRALNSCSDKLVELASARARERRTGLQAHMNEYPGEINGIMEREGMLPYEYLEKMGALGEHFLGVHSLILSEHEREIIKQYGVKLCHCPFSNCGKAVPETPDLLSRGISVGMGTDGAAHGGLSLWSEMRIFRSVMNIFHGVPNCNPKVMPAETILSMATEGGAAALGESQRLGRLEAGCWADLISIDMNTPHLIPTGNAIHTLMECVEGGDVADMIVDGKMIMKGRQVLTLDEERILSDARAYMEAKGV